MKIKTFQIHHKLFVSFFLLRKDTKAVIRIRKSQTDRQTDNTITYKIQHRKLKIEQHEPH